MSLQEQLEELKSQTLAKIEAAKELAAVETIRVETLGKKGPITEVLRGMRDLSAEERPKVGAFANEIRDMLKSAVEKRKAELTELALEKKLSEEALDVTLPGKQVPHGSRHVLTQIMEEIEDTFVGMGYQVCLLYTSPSPRDS